MKNALVLICILFTLIVTSCKHDAIVPQAPVVSFSNDVEPLIIGHCSQSGCHGSDNMSRFPLITYDDVISKGAVIAGDAYNSKIYSSIAAKTGSERMPPEPKAMLSDENITTIYLWIMQGAKNN